jgi:Holliday junction resolvase-like predicted endonuclease
LRHDVLVPVNSKLQQLVSEYEVLRALEGHTAQSRGRQFNEHIAGVLRCCGITAEANVRTRAGEIDVLLEAGGVHYVLEAKWLADKADTGAVAKLQKRVRQRPAGTAGLFLSMSGYSGPALADVGDGERLEVFLLDRQHWEAVLYQGLPPAELIRRVRASAARDGRAFTPLPDLLRLPGEGRVPLTGGLTGDGEGAGRLRVFISHTSELADYPQRGLSYVAALRAAVLAAGHDPVEMGSFPAADLPPSDLCMKLVRSCDVYAGVLGTRYGTPVRDRPELSYTELEYETATRAFLTRLMFLLDPGPPAVGLTEPPDPETGKRQEAFRRRVTDRSGLTVAYFSSPAQLEERAKDSLRDVPAAGLRSDLAALLEAADKAAVEEGLPSFLPEGAGVLRMARKVRMVDRVRQPGDEKAGGEKDAPQAQEQAYRLPGERDERDEPPVEWQQAAREHERLVVLGHPGMGKSWLMRLEAHRLAEAALTDLAHGGAPGSMPVPVLVRADVLAGQHGRTLPDAVAGYLVGQGMLAERTREWFRDLAASGGVVLLVDALDEMPREAQTGGQAPRKRLEYLLRRWVEACPGARLVVASRLDGYTGPPARDMREAKLLPFTSNDIHVAVDAWELADEAGGWLRGRLDDPAVGGMARVPLLLALICSLAKARGSGAGLPTSRAELYEQVMWQFLSGGHRAADHGAPDPALDPGRRQDLLRVLTHVAFAFADTGRGWANRMPRAGVLDAVRGAGDAFTDLGMIAPQVLERIEQAGILVPADSPANGEQDYMFLHRTIAEYLVARHLSELPAGPRMTAVRDHQWFDSDWAEVFPLLAGLLASSGRFREAGELAAWFLGQKRDPLHYAFRTALRILGDVPDSGELLDSTQERKLHDMTARLLSSSVTRRVLATAITATTTLPRPVTDALMAHRDLYVEGDKVTEVFIRYVRQATALTPAGRKSDKVTEVHMAVLTDDDPDARRTAAQALPRHKGEVTEKLITQVTDRDPLVRRAAAATLAGREGDEVTKCLLTLLIDHAQYVRQEAARALAGRDDAAILMQLANPATWSGHPARIPEYFNLATIIADRTYLQVPRSDRDQVRNWLDDLTKRV